MILTIFDSAQGDCLLLEGRDRTLVLCDGGMRTSLRTHVREALGQLRTTGREIAFAYVSHIDSDHISGILQLLEDEVAWRVFDYQTSVGNPRPRPKFPRPPVIKGLLHNAFRDQIGVNSQDVEDLLAVAVPSFFATADPRLVDVALELQQIAVSIPEAIEVSRLVASDALDIPVNKLPGATGPAKLLFFRDRIESFPVGSMTFTIVGPGHQELENLKTGWVNWLRANKERVRALRKELKRRIDEFSNGSGDSPFDLRDWNGIPDFQQVTAPNVASLMFLVEEDGKRLLLTGDSQQRKILDGLRQTALLGDRGLHVDVLKVQHHGSEHNLDAEFARQVSADHYVFCGNGLHGNPDPRVIDLIYASRRGDPAVRALAAKADNRPFSFWFSTTSAAQEEGSARQQAFRRVEQRVEELRLQAPQILRVNYNSGASIELAIE